MLAANSIISAGGKERGSLFLTHFSPTSSPRMEQPGHWPHVYTPITNVRVAHSQRKKFGCTTNLSYGTVFFPLQSYLMLHLLQKRSGFSSYIYFPLGSMLNVPAAAFDFSVVWSIRFGSLTVQAMSDSHVQSGQRRILLGKSKTLFSSLQCSAQLVLSLKARECCPLHLWFTVV